MWKVVSRFINVRIQNGIKFHPWVHGFHKQHRTSTSILDLILTTSFEKIQKDPLFTIFLDLRKSYDSVDRERLLHLLDIYGFGPRIKTIIEDYWKKPKEVVKKGSYYGRVFTPTRGVTQGDIISPILFNIIIDSVVRTISKHINKNPKVSVQSTTIFYSDDGAIFGSDTEEVQQMVDN